MNEPAREASDRMPLTYADYAALPDDGRRYELLEGELRVTPAPRSPHQVVCMHLSRILSTYVTSQGLGVLLAGPLDVILEETTVFQPDIVYLDASRLGLLRQRGVVGSPSLVVEILSPSSRALDRRRKKAIYER